MAQIAVIIPAYNEEESIGKVIQEVTNLGTSLSSHSLQIIVINDCSTDHTARIIAGLPCTDLHLPINLGIGGAVQTGFKHAFNTGFDFAIQLDGDGQHPAEFIPKLVEASISNEWDVVIGSRFIEHSGFQSSQIRRTGIRYFMWLNRLIVSQQITDSTSGFRLLNRDALKIVSEYYPDEYPEPEAIVLFRINKLRIGEIPVVMKERQGGVSSIQTFSSVYYMIKVTLAIIFTYIRLKTKK